MFITVVCFLFGPRAKVFNLRKLSKIAGCGFVGIKQIDLSFLCVCPVMDHEFRCNIVKVAIAVDPLGDNRVDPPTTLRVLRRIHKKTDS